MLMAVHTCDKAVIGRLQHRERSADLDGVTCTPQRFLLTKKRIVESKMSET